MRAARSAKGFWLLARGGACLMLAPRGPLSSLPALSALPPLAPLGSLAGPKGANGELPKAEVCFV